MPNSYVTFTGNGSNRTFSFAGIDDYLSTGYIKVYLNNQLVDPANYTIDTNGGNENVVFTVAYGAPALGITVKLARETPSTTAGFTANVADFSDGSVLTANDLDKGFKGLLHIVQEANDTGSGALPKAANGLTWDAGKLRISNAANGTGFDDLVTKAQLDAAQLYGTAATVPQAWSFTGTGTAKEFTLNPEALSTNPNMFIVEIGGVIQRPNATPPDYTIEAAKITFSSAPGSGVGIQVRNFGVARNALDVLPNASVTNQYLAANAVAEVNIQDNAVTSSKLADNSVDSGALQTGAVTAGKIGTGAITTANIQDLQVAEAKLANNAVTNAKLGPLSVSVDKIASGAVTFDKIAQNTVNYDNLNRNTGGFTSNTGTNRYLRVAGDGTLGLAQVSTIPVGTPASDVSYGSTTGSDGFTNTNLRTPTNPRDAATKGYVDTAVATTGPSTSTDPDFIDFPIGAIIVAHITGTALASSGSLGSWSITYRNRNVRLYPWVNLTVDNQQYQATTGATLPSNNTTTPIPGTWLFRGVCVATTGSQTDWLPVLLQRVA
jgi:hypothetical protein